MTQSATNTRRILSAAIPVIEGLEARKMLSTTTVQSLPFQLDFSTDRGEIIDKDGQGTGFTRLQSNKNGDQYQANLIDLDTAAGVLALTTQGAGTNSANDNTLFNALETQFDGTTSGFTITSRIKGPLTSLNAQFNQGGIYFGPDQDNYVKLVAVNGSSGQVLQFKDELAGGNATLPTSVQNVNIGSFASINTLDVRLVGDPATGKISAYYSVNGASFNKLSSDLTLSGTNKTNFFKSTSRTGIMAMTKNTGSITVNFDSFEIKAGTPTTGQPYISDIRPRNGATAISRDGFVAADIVLPTAGAGVDASTLAGNVLLYKTSDHTPIAGVVNTSGGGDALVFTPVSLLDPLTSYTFEVKTGLKDTSGTSFLAFTSTFTTGTGGGTQNANIAFEKVSLANANAGSYTCVLTGPDGKLYASTVDGLIQRFDINVDGTLSNPQTIKTIQTNNGNKARAITGFTFDPSSTSNNLIMWVSNSDGKLQNAADWSGKLTKLTGPNLATYQDVITGLPRSVRDHINNQPVFGPDGKLYFVQPSNTAMGAPDNAWGLRAEHLLTAAVLQLDLTKLGTLPLNVQTENVTTPYDPFDANAPLKIYASGVRNAFDLLWADNGHLYAPTNGSAANGAAPASPNPAISSTRIDQTINGTYNGPVVPGISQVTQTEHDWLFDVTQNGYYGHPNPVRYEWVLNGGNPTSGVDNYEVPQYPVGTQPDRNYRGVAFDFGQNYSPNGVIQYSGNAFGGALDGKILIVRYSGGDDIITLTPNNDGSIASAETGIAGFKGFVDPVDLTEDASTGFLYVAEYGGQKITLLKPIAAGANIQINKDNLYFNDIATGNTGGTGSSPTQTLTIRNTGSAPLAFPSDVLALSGADASMFSFTNAASLTTLQPGESFGLKIAFTAASTGVKTATLTIKSNDPDSAQITLSLRGLGTLGSGGNLEPSLQRILDLYNIPVNVGDSNPADTTFPVPPQSGNDEIAMPRLQKAGDGNVSIELLGVFANTKTPVIRFGYYDPGTPTSKTELFTVPDSADAQSVDAGTSGNLSFDPTTGAFGIYGTFPAFTNREVYSEDSLNTWESNAANRRKVRFYPLKDSGGNTVPNAYVFAFEEYTLSYDQNDIVGIIRNVTPAEDGPEIGLQNMDGQPFADRMVFNRIENLDALVPNVVHDTASLQIRNTGNQTLNITSMVLSSGWSFVSGGGATQISSGSTTTVKLKFIGVGTGAKSTINGTLTINSDDADESATTVSLAGFWASYSEQTPTNKYTEPTLVEFENLFGWGTSILNSGQSMNTGGKPIKVGEEVLSGYWQRADVNAPVGVTMLAALHKQSATDPNTGLLVNTNSNIKWFYQGASTTTTALFKHNQTEGQSFFPHLDNSTTQMAAATFTPNSNAFGFKVDSRYSDDALNPLDLDLNDPTFQTTIPGTGHAFRFYPVKDRAGKLVANTYLMAQDYTGISYSNYDYQDNIYLVTNVMPLSPPTAPTSVAASSSGAGLTVSWAANTEGNVVGYRVYRSDALNGTYSLLSSSVVTALRYTDVLAPTGETSFYRVTAVDANGNESAFTATSASRAADSDPPAAPSGVSATGQPTGIMIAWSDNVEVDVAGYNVYFSATENGVFAKLNTAGLLTTPTFLDSNAVGNVTSFYQITAVDSSGNESNYTAVNAIRPSVGKNGNASDMKFDSSGKLHFVWYDSGAKTLKYAERDTDGTWANIQTIDSSGNDVGSYVSLALSSSGKPAVAYFDGTNGDLKYAAYNGASWDIATVDSKQSVGLYPSLAFDKAGRPTIAYYRKSSGDLRLAVFKSTWTINDLDVTQDSGRSAVMAAKPDGYMAVAYENTTTGFLQYADQTSKGWAKSTIDNTTTGVSFISLAFDPSARASVSYYDATPANLKYAAVRSGKWKINTVSANGAVGLYTKLLFNDQGAASIFYYDRTKDVLLQAVGTLGSFSATQLASEGGKYITADTSPVTGKINYAFYDNATSAIQIASS